MMSSKSKQSPKKGASKPRSEDCVLTFPLLKTADNEKHLPQYTAILNRPEEKGVGMEDLDALQLELEALLSAVVVRSRVLSEEIQVLNNAEKKRDKKGKLLSSATSSSSSSSSSSSTKPPLSPGKRSKQPDRPSKKYRDSSGKVRSSEGAQTLLPIKFTKVKSLPTPHNGGGLNVIIPEQELSDLPCQEPPKIISKNDTPNKFWASVEPYCADITPDDIHLLDELIKDHDNDSEYFKIPPLGRHYSSRWAQEDMLEDQESLSNDKGKRNTGNVSDVNGLLKKAEKNMDCHTTTGPLSQRLVQALLEDNLVVPMSDSFEGNRKFRSGENVNPKPAVLRNFAALLEKRVRKELEEQGILDIADVTKETSDDEILQEIKRCQSELKSITAHNLEQLKKLRKKANQELARQELRKNLQAADNEVIEVYKKVLAAKQKKKPLSPKENEQAWKVVKDREALINQLETM